MRGTQRLPRVILAVTCAFALTACDDDPLASGADCPNVSQTAAEVERERAAGSARVRVNIVSRLGIDPASTERLGLNRVVIYQGSKCLGLATTSMPVLGGLENDMGGAVADAAVKFGEITHVMLESSTAGTDNNLRHLRGEKIALSEPVHLTPVTRTDLFLAIDSIPGSTEVRARFIAAGIVDPRAGAVMVAEPGRGGRMSTLRGFDLELGSKSMSLPTVYSVVEHDVGDVSPLLSLIPEGKLGAQGRLRFRVDRGRVPQGMTMDDYSAYVGNDAGVSTLSGNTVTMNVSSLGLTGMRTDRSHVQFSDGTRMAVPAGSGSTAAMTGGRLQVSNTCLQSLIQNQAYYYSEMKKYAGMRIYDCENQPPYVHIVLVNMKMGGSVVQYPKIKFPFELVGTIGNTTQMHLNTITDLAERLGGPAFVAVNGFYWTGALGMGGGHGTPMGTVYFEGVKRSYSFSDAESIIGFTSSSPTTGTSAAMFNKPTNGSVSLGAYGWNAVPSTTSIIRNGVCSRTSSEPGLDHWSAIGFGNGLLVLASSRTGTKTTAYELCSVFEGLSTLGGAIRMDGSGSAGMYWLSTHLNPLSGDAYFKYGNARFIPYAIAATQYW